MSFTRAAPVNAPHFARSNYRPTNCAAGINYCPGKCDSALPVAFLQQMVFHNVLHIHVATGSSGSRARACGASGSRYALGPYNTVDPSTVGS